VVDRRRGGDVDDDGVVGGPPFGGEHARDRSAAGRVGAQAVDGLGRKGDELSLPQQLGGSGNGGGIDGADGHRRGA
jgi:hypothetical protein